MEIAYPALSWKKSEQNLISRLFEISNSRTLAEWRMFYAIIFSSQSFLHSRGVSGRDWTYSQECDVMMIKKVENRNLGFLTKEKYLSFIWVIDFVSANLTLRLARLQSLYTFTPNPFIPSNFTYDTYSLNQLNLVFFQMNDMIFFWYTFSVTQFLSHSDSEDFKAISVLLHLLPPLPVSFLCSTFRFPLFFIVVDSILQIRSDSHTNQ